MPSRAPASPVLRLVLAIALAGSILAACTSDDEGSAGGGGGASSAHAEAVPQLIEVLPSDARGGFAVDLATLSGDGAGGTKDAVEGLLEGSGDPALAEPFGHIGRLTGVLEDPAAVDTALLVQPVDPANGPYLLATVDDGTTAEDLDAAAAEDAGLSIDLGGIFGTADSSSTFTATRDG